MAQRTSDDRDLWYPKAGATGIPFARGRVEGVEVMLVHAAPPVLTVTVRSGDGRVLAEGTDLEQTDDTPITRLTRRGDRIEREDIWPGESDIGRLVLLPGGEAGTLVHWWNAEDHSSRITRPASAAACLRYGTRSAVCHCCVFTESDDVTRFGTEPVTATCYGCRT